jgi:hypothetical protein
MRIRKEEEYLVKSGNWGIEVGEERRERMR